MVKYFKTTLKSLLYSDEYPHTFKNTSDYESKMVYEGLHVDLNYNFKCNINFNKTIFKYYINLRRIKF